MLIHDQVPDAIAVESELAVLERKLGSLLAHTRALRAANDALRHELAVAQQRNRALAERLDEAGQRLDALIARLPEGTS